MNAVGALLYLRGMSAWNRILSRLRRLRQPKYLAGAIVGACYLYFIYFRRLGSTRQRFTASAITAWDVAPADLWKISVAVGALALLVLVLGMWLLPSENPGLAFSEAETAFLFPAPLTRRSLINFKLASSQLGVFFQALFFALIFNARGLGSNRTAMILVGWWIILTALNLHYTGASLSVAKLVERGVGVPLRRAAVAGLVLLCIVATFLVARHGWRPIEQGDSQSLTALSRYLAANLDQGAMHYLLLPFGWIVRPFLAPDFPTFFRALPVAVVIIVAEYFWVSQLEVPFEEASLARAERRSALLAARRGGNFSGLRRQRQARRAPFALSDSGRPEIALFWKNLLTIPRLLSLRVIFWVVTIVGLSLLGHGLVALLVFGLILLFGPMLARQDLRSDLPQSEILKTYPLAGWQVVLGETLTPVFLLSAALFLALSSGFAVAPWPRWEWATFSFRLIFFGGLSCCLPLLTTVMLLIPNAAALIFPAWFETTKNRTGGIDVMGQRIIFLVGQWLVIVTALIPAALVASGIYFGLHLLDVGPAAALLPAALGTLAILAGEAALGIWLLGDQFEKIDIAQELRP